MQLYHSLEELESLPAPLSYAIGVFDGLHSGHREVVEHALLESREDGSTVVITFDPHPLEVLAPEKAPRLLTSTVHKQQLLKRIGVEHLCVLPFTEEFAAKTAREFVDDLLKAGGKEGIASIWVGEEFLFGKGATGDVALMREVAEMEGFKVGAVPQVHFGDGRISSTRIRHAVQLGDLSLSRDLLGRDYTIWGTVIEGRHLGAEMGFPTANLKVHNEQLPPNGVYAVEVDVSGQIYFGVGNLGVRPTVEEGEVKRMLEVHLFAFKGLLYGQDLEVKFLHFLREEQKFEGLAELQEQIERDVLQAKELMKLS